MKLLARSPHGEVEVGVGIRLVCECEMPPFLGDRLEAVGEEDGLVQVGVKCVLHPSVFLVPRPPHEMRDGAVWQRAPMRNAL